LISFIFCGFYHAHTPLTRNGLVPQIYPTTLITLISLVSLIPLIYKPYARFSVDVELTSKGPEKDEVAIAELRAEVKAMQQQLARLVESRLE